MTGEITTTIVGNLTADPELRYTQSGLAVVNFTIAVTPRVYDSSKKEWKDGEASFIRSTAWRDLAEHIAASLSKGSRAIATGTFQQKEYETKEGEKRTTFEFTVEEIGAALKYATVTITRAAAKSADEGAPAEGEEFPI